MNFMLNVFRATGVEVIVFFAGFFSVCKSVGALLFDVALFRFYKKVFLLNLVKVFWFSLPVIFLTSFFTGAVLTLQTYSGFGDFASIDSLAKVISLSIIKELGPVISGLMIAGKLGSSIAAEISTMKVSDQINALKTLSIDPNKFIVVPITLAVVVSMPFILVFSDVIGFFGSYVVVKTYLHLPTFNYLVKLVDLLFLRDFLISVVKVSTFGFCIGFCASYIGINSKDGASGVGSSTTNTVVCSSILILVSNYVITFLFF